MDYMDSAASFSFGVLGLFPLFFVAVYVVLVIGMWKIFEKAGVKGYWSLVPFVNSYYLYQITLGNGWFFLASFIPVVGILASIVSLHRLSTSFGKDIGFTLGLIFFPFIFYCVLGFGDAQYTAPEPFKL